MPLVEEIVVVLGGREVGGEGGVGGGKHACIDEEVM